MGRTDALSVRFDDRWSVNGALHRAVAVPVQGLLALRPRPSRHASDPRGWGFEVMGPAGDNGLGSTFAVGFCWPVRALRCGANSKQTTCADCNDLPDHLVGTAETAISRNGIYGT